MFDIVVVGGGAAGMLAAGVAAERGSKVLLLERNERLGNKLRITGKGRCNLTNDSTVAEVLENIPTGRSFLHSSVNAFGPSDVMKLFASLGVPLKTERGNRVFPQSDKAADVAAALERYINKTGAVYRQGRANGILTKDGRITGVATGDSEIKGGAVILATGGMSYPATGSNGDGYRMAGLLGHTVTPLRGSLVPLEAEPAICRAMQGLTLKNVIISVFDGGRKPVYEDFGELLFTHFGISGPLVLSASAHMRDYESKKYHAFIDFKPALDEKKLDSRILRDFSKYSNRDLINALGDLLNRLCIPIVVEKSGIPPNTKVHSITREQRLKLVKLLKAFRIDIIRPRPVEEAIVTSGGIDVREINPKTMESKLVRGLYFAGEIIDADAYTGGFNLQIAWSTAYAAAQAASQGLGSRE